MHNVLLWYVHCYADVMLILSMIVAAHVEDVLHGARARQVYGARKDMMSDVQRGSASPCS